MELPFLSSSQQGSSTFLGRTKGVPHMDLAKHLFSSHLNTSALTTKDQNFTLHNQLFVSQWFSLDLPTPLSLFFSIMLLTCTSTPAGTSDFP